MLKYLSTQAPTTDVDSFSASSRNVRTTLYFRGSARGYGSPSAELYSLAMRVPLTWPCLTLGVDWARACTRRYE